MSIYHWNNETNIKFCEGKMNENYPIENIKEFINGITSLFLSFCGIYGLSVYRKYRLSRTNQLLYTLLIICGIGSCFFHFTLNHGWKMMDEIPMIMLITIGCSYYVYIANQNNKIKTILIDIFALSYLLITIEVDYLEKEPYFFRYLFGIPFIYVIYLLSINKQNCKKDIKSIINKSLFYGISGFFFWILDLFLCNNFTVFLYLHSFWHIHISLCGYYLIEFLQYMNITQKKKTYITVNKILTFVDIK